MFEDGKEPRVFGLPPGLDFPAALVAGLRARLGDAPPEAMARVTLVVNTRRMARRIREIFDAGSPALLPRILLVTDLGQLADAGDVPPAVPGLRRRLELTQLVSALLDRAPDLAPRASLFALADSLAALMGEMQGEGVAPDAIKALDVSDQSGHWDRAKSFLDIALRYFDDSGEPPDGEARQRMVIERLGEAWQAQPPLHPVIVAGSTGSRGATRLLMRAAARLPQGAVVLPGFDFDMPGAVWDGLGDALSGEDHPQFRFRQLLDELSLTAQDVKRWNDAPPPAPARNRVVSLALRPAPVTDQWRAEGPGLREIDRAFADVTLLEATSTRAEALAIAMRLRRAAEEGTSAALITPDRVLTRQVAAALDRWEITADDSAGTPLHLTPPGRFLRQVAGLGGRRLAADALIALLKHPLTNSGPARGPHLLLTRDLEMSLRRKGPPYPDADSLRAWRDKSAHAEAAAWVDWVETCFLAPGPPARAALSARVDHHVLRAEAIARGPAGMGAGALWDEAPGRAAREAVAELQQEAAHGGEMGARDYEDLFLGLLSAAEVREGVEAHPLIRIWGTLEARVQGADLLILASLNDGTWPESPAPDPWLNRKMRHDAGLSLPERRIGLAAHDFQQAIGAREVWLTRAIRSDDAETVPSRWLNRLTNLLSGLPDQGGIAALAGMRERGAHWAAMARALEAVTPVPPAPRPSPCPEVGARPRQLSVTRIRTLIRDPYAIYARYVLGLKPLDPLMRVPDALLRGIAIHQILERFVAASEANPKLLTSDDFVAFAAETLSQKVPWADARLMWQARLERAAAWFVEGERKRRALAMRSHLETGGHAELSTPGFTLTAEADRIDVLHDGSLAIYDYKTGTPPTAKQQKSFDKQLLLEAAIAEAGGFEDAGKGRVLRATYIGLGSDPKEVDAPLDEVTPAEVWADLGKLISRYLDTAQGFTARRAMFSTEDKGDYDQLARWGEWDVTTPARKERVG